MVPAVWSGGGESYLAVGSDGGGGDRASICHRSQFLKQVEAAVCNRERVRPWRFSHPLSKHTVALRHSLSCRLLHRITDNDKT